MRISKSNYLIGRQCSRRLWLAKHGSDPEPQAESEDVWEMREVEGAAVERLVERLYDQPERIACRPDHEELQQVPSGPDGLAQRTRAALELRRPVFQAYLQTEHLLAVADILEPRGDAWYLWEVKASTSFAPIHDYDLAFQVEVARQNGLEIVGAGIWLLNKDYVRGAELDHSQLLTSVDRSEQVFDLCEVTRAEVERLLALLRAGSVPAAQPSARCKANRKAKLGDRPSSCGHLGEDAHCGKELPEHWTGRLPKLSAKKAQALADMGTSSIEALDLTSGDIEWTGTQGMMIEAVQTGQPFINRAALQLELAKLVWPITYVDFEFDPGMAVPRFPGTWPYARVPFQWSIHIQRAEGAELEQPEPFLWLETTDPRQPFLDSLLAALPESGSIVAHSKAAEWTVLVQLARAFGGEFAARVEVLGARLYDTLDLLQSGYYHPAQRGSYSIKRAAPALLGRGYEDLDIQDGMAAVVSWKKAIDPATDPKTRADLAASLREYCGRDTLLMYDIVEAVRGLVG